MSVKLLEPPPEDDVLGFLRETVARVEQKNADGVAPVAVVTVVLYRGGDYTVHQRGTRASGTLAIVGVLDAARQRIVRDHLDG